MIAPVTKEARAKRVKATAEVFTPDQLVCEMLSKLPKEMWKPNKTFCDPAVGNGQFLVWVLIKKLSLRHDPTKALQSLYGVDIMADNVNETRLRLLKVLCVGNYKKITKEHIKIVLTNIIHIPAGSLDYDFQLDHQPNQKEINKWMNAIYHFKGIGLFKTFDPITGKHDIHIPDEGELRKCLAILNNRTTKEIL